jgi:hypothetical protein
MQDKVKSIRETYLYETFNKGGEFDNILKNFMTKAIVATPSMLDHEYNTIKNYFKYPLKISIMDAVEEGIVVPMAYPKGITANFKVPTNMPFLLTTGNAGVCKAIAIIDNYAKVTDDKVTIEPNKLYTLLETAFIARSISMNFNNIRHNAIMYTEGTSIFAHMFTRVLNRQYALNVDKDAYNKVIFLSSKYFLINILAMKDSDMIFNYALKTAGNLNPIMAKRLNDAIPDSSYATIATFIKAIADNAYLIINGIEKLTVREYIANFIKMYNNAALFSLEHISYFLFNVISCINHAYFNNQYAFEEAIGTKSGDKLYAHIANRVRR